MPTVGLLLLIAGGLLIWEVSRSLGGSLGAQTPTALASTGAPVTPATGDQVGQNVATLANWAKANNIDPRIALTVLAAEGAPGGGGTHIDTNGLVTSGPLQINAANAPNQQASQNWIAYVDNISNDIAIYAAQKWGVLKGISYQQFLSQPVDYFTMAQGANRPIVAQNFAANGNYVSQVSAWCQQYGVC